MLDVYLKVLVGNLKLMRDFGIDHNNDSKHSSKLIQKFLQYKNMKILSFLSLNSDMKITENLCNELKTYNSKKTKHFATKQEMWRNIFVNV